MIRQVWLQEETELRLRKTKFIIFTSPRGKEVWHAIQGHMEKHQVVRRQKTGASQKFESEPFLGFPWEKQDRARQIALGLAGLKIFVGLWAIEVVQLLGMIEAEEYCLLWYRGQAEKAWLWIA